MHFQSNVFFKCDNLFVLANLSCKSCNKISQEVFPLISWIKYKRAIRKTLEV